MTELKNMLLIFQKIKNIEVCENGKGLFNTSNDRNSSLASAAIGGLLFGGAGAIVGAVAGQNQSKINDVSISFHMDDFKTPYVRFNFIGLQSVGKGSSQHQKAIEQAQNTYGRILNIMDDIKNGVEAVFVTSDTESQQQTNNKTKIDYDGKYEHSEKELDDLDESVQTFKNNL